MAEPFERRATSRGLGRLLGSPRKASAIRELEDLLARCQRICDVEVAQVEEVARSHGVDFARRLATPRRHLYRRFLEHCLLDGHVSEEESEDLTHLRALLCLTDEEAASVHEDVAVQVYGRAIDQVLEDHRLDPDEEQFLSRVRTELQIPDETAADMLRRGEARARHRFLEKTASFDSVWLAEKKRTLELNGRSAEGVEHAVKTALDEAAKALPDLSWAEVVQIRADVGEHGIREWLVKVKAGLGPES
jgi:flavin-binding protein dodecin